MVLRDALSKYRVLMAAIGISFALHCFWLSVVKVVTAPENMRTARFSRISFLGPILTKTATEVRASPRTRSFLEDRYNVIARDAARIQSVSAKGAYLRYDAGEIQAPSTSQRLIALIDEAVSGTKLEPSSNIE